MNLEEINNNSMSKFTRISFLLKDLWIQLKPSIQNPFKLIATLIVLAALPLTIYINQQVQNLNNFAATSSSSSCNNGLVCQACTPSTNTCSYGNGTQSCSYTTSIDGQACNPVNFASVICYKANCSTGYSCVNQQCVTPTGISPTPISSVYDATYTATTASDQTAALKSFIEVHRGKRIVISGVVPVTSLVVTLAAGATTTVDFAVDAKLQSITANKATLVLSNAWDMVFNDLAVVGTGWDGTYYATRQWEAGVLIEGGGRLTFNRPNIRDTKGDGFDVDQHDSSSAAAVDVVINNPTLYQNARNGITGNAGKLTVNGGTIDRSGLHSIDMEPNWDSAARSIDVTFNNMRLTNHGVLYVADNPGDPDITGFAIAGLGYSDAQKQKIDIRNVSADKFTIAVDRANTAYFMNNSSDTPVTCNNTGTCADTVFIYGMTTLTMSNNTNMIINTVYDLAGPR